MAMANPMVNWTGLRLGHRLCREGNRVPLGSGSDGARLDAAWCGFARALMCARALGLNAFLGHFHGTSRPKGGALLVKVK